jgi:TolA-binding protein
VTDGEHDCSALAEGAAAADRVADLESELAELTDRVAELEAATQALRGYVGNVRSVNSEVEKRADLALSKAEAARRAVDRAGAPASGADTGSPARDPAAGAETAGDEHAAPERCDRCDRPLDDEPEPFRGDASRSGAGAHAESSRLDALGGEGDVGRADERVAAAGAHTDGGVDRDDEASGVFGRVRALL